MIDILEGPTSNQRSYSLSYLIEAFKCHFDIINDIIDLKLQQDHLTSIEDKAYLVNILGLMIAIKNSYISHQSEITYDLFKYEIKDNLLSWTIHLKQQNKNFSDQFSAKKQAEQKNFLN